MGEKKLELIHTILPQHGPGLREELDYEFFANFKSEHTRKSYRSDIQQFFNFIVLNFTDIKGPGELRRFHMVAYRNYLESLELAPKTINRKLSSVSSYFDFLCEKNLMAHNVLKSIKRPRQEIKTPTNDLSDEEVSRLLQSFNPQSPSYYLHRAVIFLLFFTGIRKSELIFLKRKDYKMEKETKIISITAKGGKQLIKVIHPLCADALEQYLTWCAKEGLSHSPEDWLFRPTKNPLNPRSLKGLNKPLRPSTIDYILRETCKRAKIERRVSPHSARATYIGSSLESGAELWRVSRDVGHSSVKTTEIYNKRRQDLKESPAFHLGFAGPRKKS